jgi:hypothetical protein
MEKAVQDNGCSMGSLTVLATQRDPYRLDTPTGHRNAAWFAEMIDRFLGPEATVHLRGMHYRVSSAADINMPNGKPYTNTDEDWEWLQEDASKAARWLGYVPFNRIIDERNAPPELFIPAALFPRTELSYGTQATFPEEVSEAMPALLSMGGFSVRQAFRIVLFGEKTSLGPVLRPIAEMVGGELLLPTGEASDTMIAELAERASADSRPSVVLYFSDFDPSGRQMAVSVSRKLQAFHDLHYPNLDIRLYPVALTLQQVRRLGLPSTPLKEKERRADKWRAVMGHEQTEIDALAALHPEELRSIALDAIQPFYDSTLKRRVAHAEIDWQREATARLESHPAYESAQAAIGAALATLQAAAEAFNQTQEDARNALLEIEPPPIHPPGPQTQIESAPASLFTTDDDFVTASRRLIDHKALNGG